MDEDSSTAESQSLVPTDPPPGVPTYELAMNEIAFAIDDNPTPDIARDLLLRLMTLEEMLIVKHPVLKRTFDSVKEGAMSDARGGKAMSDFEEGDVATPSPDLRVKKKRRGVDARQFIDDEAKQSGKASEDKAEDEAEDEDAEDDTAEDEPAEDETTSPRVPKQMLTTKVSRTKPSNAQRIADLRVFPPCLVLTVATILRRPGVRCCDHPRLRYWSQCGGYEVHL
jgi:hypothetical protein